jgi:LPXTG-motif cell wall-anchored protein
MKNLSKIAALASGVFAAAIVSISVLPVFADSPPQLGGGPDVYVVKDLTSGGNYANITNSSACHELKYSVRLHNTSFGGFTNVHVSVNLPAGATTHNVSTMTATTNVGGHSGTTGTATVELSSAQSISMENGTTVLYDANGNVIRTLPDSVTSSGVDIGALNGSTTEFVQFKARVSCPSPTPTPTPPPTPTPTPTPVATTLPNTGAGGVIGLFAGATVLAAAGHYIVRRTRRA